MEGDTVTSRRWSFVQNRAPPSRSTRQAGPLALLGEWSTASQAHVATVFRVLHRLVSNCPSGFICRCSLLCCGTTRQPYCPTMAWALRARIFPMLFSLLCLVKSSILFFPRSNFCLFLKNIVKCDTHPEKCKKHKFTAL